ncbi:PaaI family thioesterase [Kineobactrum sediminis]|uniref:PaaI family thioesterase n=1 Tax=Kineobactrum sediminis TaxID=1905677 RepID=A0A2N5Y2V3_9GAMM|nr:PaaI family thioesterase [Kineobactrum sediminis]PLW82689.1 PaaI family thioesterase [Kineobactrum sediminis]
MIPDFDYDAPIFNPFTSEEIAPPFSAHWEAKRRAAQAVRELTEVLVTSNADIATLNAFTDSITASRQHLAEQPRLYGVTAFIREGGHGHHGEVNHELNAVGGFSNPLAPQLNMWLEKESAFGTVTCGYAYEGPPGYIHGGYIAAIFDQFLGMAQLMGKNPGMTGCLTVRYHRPTPLNTPLDLSASLRGSEGRKTVVTGEMHAAGELTASCEGLFIRPRAPLKVR